MFYLLQWLPALSELAKHLQCQCVLQSERCLVNILVTVSVDKRRAVTLCNSGTTSGVRLKLRLVS